MKLISLYVAASLTFSLAAPVDQRDANLSVTRTIGSPAPSGPTPSPVPAADLALRASAHTSFEDATNITISSAQNTVVTVAIGALARNVGNLLGSALYGTIWKGLDSICPPGQSECRKSTSGKHTYESFAIELEYVDKGDSFAHGPYLTLIVEHSFHRTEALRRLMIGSVAGALERSTRSAENCRNLRRDSWTSLHCNVGDSVAVLAGGSKLIVGISSRQDKGDGGGFDCGVVVDGAREYVDSLMPEYGREFGGGALADVKCV
ncbi:hypothetical protein BU26DRAFT_501117 [Trematosphaeria pertusa]|uniref:Uncharacterized protein n=1 Tax=Trematosphaeria pertusa TaxID=390896 RepID=A0A6A6IUG4_9PLEO|nr:uncharacterized protein BU26DRAFT_501117 [Trematosphaeria pertusa]KAF2252823.1 hypothetical protein BU26DRAFT_501117 [Trematosphaeria pertusa]